MSHSSSNHRPQRIVPFNEVLILTLLTLTAELLHGVSACVRSTYYNYDGLGAGDMAVISTGCSLQDEIKAPWIKCESWDFLRNLHFVRLKMRIDLNTSNTVDYHPKTSVKVTNKEWKLLYTASVGQWVAKTNKHVWDFTFQELGFGGRLSMMMVQVNPETPKAYGIYFCEFMGLDINGRRVKFRSHVLEIKPCSKEHKARSSLDRHKRKRMG